jgi:hypothetical protein
VLTEPAQKTAALAHFIDALLPGRAAESRAPDTNELAATAVLEFEMTDVSGKVRTGGAKDDKADLSLPHWCGVVPASLRYGTPQTEENCDAPLPDSVRRLLESQA